MLAVLKHERVGREEYMLQKYFCSETMSSRYLVIRSWFNDYEERRYRNFTIATNEFFRQTQEATGYHHALNAKWTPQNDHQFNGASLRHIHEEQTRLILMEVNF